MRNRVEEDDLALMSDPLVRTVVCETLDSAGYLVVADGRSWVSTRLAKAMQTRFANYAELRF